MTIIDESNKEVIGSPKLTELRIPSVQQNEEDQVAVTDECFEQAHNDENVATVTVENPTSSAVITGPICMESIM